MKATVFKAEEAAGHWFVHVRFGVTERPLMYRREDLERAIGSEFLAYNPGPDGSLTVDYEIHHISGRDTHEIELKGLHEIGGPSAWQTILDKAAEMTKAVASAGTEMTLAQAVNSVVESEPELKKRAWL